MANLSNPTLQIDILTGQSTVQVTGTVYVELSPFETYLVSAGLPLQLESKLWGNDGGGGEDDLLYSLSTLNITGPGTYTISANLPKTVLNEDNSWSDKRDEVYSVFNLVSGTNLFPINVPSSRSPDIQGYF
jgi:hypothetical protein